MLSEVETSLDIFVKLKRKSQRKRKSVG